MPAFIKGRKEHFRSDLNEDNAVVVSSYPSRYEHDETMVDIRRFWRPTGAEEMVPTKKGLVIPLSAHDALERLSRTLGELADVGKETEQQKQ